MNETKVLAAEIKPQSGTGFERFVDMLITLAKHKKLIVGLPIATALVAAAISLTFPNLYKSSTKLLPPQQAQSGAAALLSQLGGTMGAVAGAAGIKNPNELYMGLLRSRAVTDKLISKFDLKNAYKSLNLEQARQRLIANTIIASGKDGIIEIAVIDSDKKRAAQLANSYVEELRRLTQGLALTEASQRRAFFGQQLELAKNNLASSEIRLKAALDVNGVISVDSDSRAIVETVSRLRAQIAAKEIELSALQPFVTPNNQEYKRVQQQIRSLREEYSQLQNGSSELQGEEPRISKNQSGLGNIKTLREVKYQQMLYEMLAKQFEVARLDEARDAPIVQVLDVAIEAEQKFKPARAVIVLVSSFLAFLIAIAIALINQARENASRNPEQAAKWKQLKSSLRFR